MAVGVVDLSGSSHGRWSEATAPGTCRSVRVQVLLPAPEEWAATAAVLGTGGGRFMPLPFTVVPHRQGRALQVELPVDRPAGRCSGCSGDDDKDWQRPDSGLSVIAGAIPRGAAPGIAVLVN